MIGSLSKLAGAVRLAKGQPVDPPVTVVFASRGYLPVLANWLLHARSAGMANILVLALDRQTADFARMNQVSFAPLPSVASRKELWGLRVRVFAALARAGVSFIHSDADAVWLSSPYSMLANADADLVFSQGTIWPRDVAVSRGFVVCCGFFAVKASSASVRLLESARRRVNIKADDQVVLNRALDDWGLVWDGGGDPQIRQLNGHNFMTYPAVRIGRGHGLTVALLPHREVTRLPEVSPETVVAHPYSSELNVEDRLRALGLWSSPATNGAS
jgi:hypothetical protein